MMVLEQLKDYEMRLNRLIEKNIFIYLMSHVILDFNTLKFNLYEILNISSDASEIKIKKAFRKLVLNFHPDKGNCTEEEIYYHIVTANQILTNKEYRTKYDDFLLESNKTHDELKNKYNTLDNTLNKESALKEYNVKFMDLDKKHKINDFDYTNSIEKIIKTRENEINIPKENILNTDDFNNKFEDKKENKLFNDELIVVDEDTNLSTYNVNENYTTLDLAFNNLYIDGGGINTTKYSCINSAFKIQPINTRVIKDVNVKAEIDKYKNTKFNDIKYTKDKYEQW